MNAFLIKIRQSDKQTAFEVIHGRYYKITDDKPFTARQCIKALPGIAKHKPELTNDIRAALGKTDPQRYADSIQSLVYKDITAALKKISE